MCPYHWYKILGRAPEMEEKQTSSLRSNLGGKRNVASSLFYAGGLSSFLAQNKFPVDVFTRRQITVFTKNWGSLNKKCIKSILGYGRKTISYSGQDTAIIGSQTPPFTYSFAAVHDLLSAAENRFWPKFFSLWWELQNKLQFPRLSPLLRRARAWRRRYPTSLLFAELNIQPFARLTFHLPHLGCITNSLPKLHHFCQSKFFRILLQTFRRRQS